MKVYTIVMLYGKAVGWDGKTEIPKEKVTEHIINVRKAKIGLH